MRQHLDGNDLFADIKMQRQVDSRALIIVEGYEDCGIIDPHLNEEVAATTPGYGKQSVILAASLCRKNQMERIAFVVDADLDRFIGDQLPSDPNIIVTEFHDLDAELVFTCPLIVRHVLANHAKRGLLRRHCNRIQKTPEDIFIDIASRIGYIRLLSITGQWFLAMRDFPIRPLIATYERGDSVAPEVLRIATSRTKPAVETSIDPTEVEVSLIADSDRRRYCSGHDISSILSALIHYRWGGHGAGQDIVASALRSAAAWSCWQKTRTYQRLEAWALQRGLALWSSSDIV